MCPSTRRLQRNRRMEKVCIPIANTEMEKAITSIQRAELIADLIELRVDTMKNPDLPELLRGRRKPVIITNRRQEEGGGFRGDESARVRVLEKGVRLGVDYVDIELQSERSLIQALIRNVRRGKTRIILSYHDTKGAPSQRELRKICDRMIGMKAEVIKIVTFAQTWEDNLDVLELIPYARARNQKITAFCMGQKGKLSRVAAPWMGAVWTYASLDSRTASAPGQMTVREMRKVWERLR